MRAVAAQAAAIPRPRSEFIDHSAGGASRRWLRSVPAQAGPVVQLELGNPLQLTKAMRARLLEAVRALVSDPALKGAGDPARLAAVVLMAKAKVADDYSTRITAKELGRWVGLKTSRIAHKVLPELRERGVLGSNETTNATGRMTGLECWVIPMYRAQHGGDRRHVLALSRVELVVLLKLIEALFAPGWADKDGRVARAGMLADRTGRGAATDRLGLLLMVLSSNSKGWLQLCSGSVDTERGRPAATAARLLSCSPAAGAKVLSRLQEQDVLRVDRRETASGLNARSRVRLLPVARAHGVLVREAREAASSVFSDLAGSASGDHETAGDLVFPVATCVKGTGQGEGAGSADLAGAAHLHASHAPVVTPGGSLSLPGGFSGEGRGGSGDLPERACEREDQAVNAGAVDRLRLIDGEDGPLRGEKPKMSLIDEVGSSAKAAAAWGVRLTVVDGRPRPQQRGRRVATLDDLRLRVALVPVADLWGKLGRGQQEVVRRAADQALGVMAGLVDPQSAPQLLADRLADRLAEAGGEALVRDPMGWLLGRGLVQRQLCGDRRCDDGIRLDTRGDCAGCTAVTAGRRSVRARVRSEIDEEFAGTDAAVRRAAFEERLRERTVLEAGLERARHARAAGEVKARRDAAARRREAEEAAELGRRAAACVRCGLPGAAGLCPQCAYGERAEALVGEAVDLVVAVRADLDDSAQVAVLTERCAADTRALLAKTCRRDSGGDEALEAFMAPQVAQRILDERRVSAVRRLLVGEEAETEAGAVYEAVLRRRPRAHRAAEEAAEQARQRTAQYLLERRLGQLRVLRARVEAGRAPRRAG